MVSLSLGNPPLPLADGPSGDAHPLRQLRLGEALFLAQLRDEAADTGTVHFTAPFPGIRYTRKREKSQLTPGRKPREAAEILGFAGSAAKNQAGPPGGALGGFAPCVSAASGDGKKRDHFSPRRVRGEKYFSVRKCETGPPRWGGPVSRAVGLFFHSLWRLCRQSEEIPRLKWRRHFRRNYLWLISHSSGKIRSSRSRVPSHSIALSSFASLR